MRAIVELVYEERNGIRNAMGCPLLGAVQGRRAKRDNKRFSVSLHPPKKELIASDIARVAILVC